MFDWLKKYRLFLAIVLTLIGTLIYLFEIGQNQEKSSLQSITQTITYPIQIFAHTVVSFSNNLIQSYFNLLRLREENQALKQQVSALKEEVNHYIEEAVQYQRLKIQFEFAEQNLLEKIFAEVIGESVDNFHQTLQINRGAKHGIRRNYAVILKEGVVGRIQSVTPFQSTVQLILDRRSRFPAILQQTRAKGLIYGTSDGLEMRRIHLRADIKEGDRVVTSGLSDLFPKGILVGTVSAVLHEEHELFQTAKLIPVVDFDTIEGVFVILKTNPLSDEFLSDEP